MVLGRYEVPVAYSMVEVAVRARNQPPDVTHLFMCYWAAFNNIYVTIAERTGRRARLLKNPDGSIKTRQAGHVDIPQVSTVPEREQHTLVFQRFTDHLKQELVEHDSTRFFAERTPSWRGCPIELDITGQRLNGVLNVGYTVDANHPVWAPINVVEFAAYFDEGKTPLRRDILARQILDVLYTVRNNTFHGGKRVDDANDMEVLAKALPLLAMVVESFVRLERAA